MKIQNMKDLEAEMRAVARGEATVPTDAALPSVESAGGLVRVLTPENRHLMRIIRDEKPQSVAELAKLTDRAEPNLLRTLTKLAAYGLLELKTVKRCKVPVPMIGKLHVEIDPFTMADRVEIY